MTPLNQYNMNNLQKSLHYLQQAIRNDFVGNNKIKLIDALDIIGNIAVRKINIIEIIENYHERLNFSSQHYDEKIICPVCGNKTYSLISIEHNSKDIDKDLNICNDCYLELINNWKNNSPEKLIKI